MAVSPRELLETAGKLLYSQPGPPKGCSGHMFVFQRTLGEGVFWKISVNPYGQLDQSVMAARPLALGAHNDYPYISL